MNDLLSTFNAAGIRYLLAGGQAMRLYGMPEVLDGPQVSRSDSSGAWSAQRGCPGRRAGNYR